MLPCRTVQLQMLLSELTVRTVSTVLCTMYKFYKIEGNLGVLLHSSTSCHARLVLGAVACSEIMRDVSIS